MTPHADQDAQKLRDFDPNAHPQHTWATYIPRRRQAFKIHSSRAMALNAVHWGGCGGLYRWDEDASRWELVTTRWPVTLTDASTCVSCGGSLTVRSAYVGGRVYIRSYGGWRKLYPRGPLVEPPEYLHPVCQACDRAGAV